jgi:ABC-2 type transport system ATP-binding protein
MRQKLAVCCAYLHDPGAILLDEPLTGLDPRSIRTMHDSIRQRAQAGAAVIISSHFLAMVEELCTDILILHRGERLFVGPIADARGAFAVDGGDSSLEEVFLRATEGPAVVTPTESTSSRAGDA